MGTIVTPNLAFYAESNGAAESAYQVLLKNREQGLIWADMALTLITDTDYPGHHTYAVTSITRSGTTATVTTTATNALETGDVVTIAGAAQTDYNGDFTITMTSGTTFTYTVANSPTTPATGTITAYGGKTTVPGVVYLDGYFFVMDDKARIWNSSLGDGTSWDALDFITAEKEPGGGVAIGKSQNYVIALKEWSIEFFYDAANAVGSPLSPVESGFSLVGCASGESLANLDGLLMWVSQTRQKGRSVHLLDGMSPVQLSTPDIERILNADDLATVYSYGLKTSGHRFYVLTLVTSNITLVYDLGTKLWYEWSSLTLNGSSKSVSTMTRSDTTVTVTATAHGFSDGDPVLIAGANQSDYNGVKQIQYVDADTFRFHVSSNQATTATGTITATGYTESYFKFTKYVHSGGKDLVLHETDGHLYEISDTVFQDDGVPIDVVMRTPKLDGETTDNKTMAKVEVIGNKVSSHAMVRWSDDDYTTWTRFRLVDLSASRSQVRRCGDYRRRAFEIRHNGNAAIQLAELEI